MKKKNPGRIRATRAGRTDPTRPELTRRLETPGVMGTADSSHYKRGRFWWRKNNKPEREIWGKSGKKNERERKKSGRENREVAGGGGADLRGHCRRRRAELGRGEPPPQETATVCRRRRRRKGKRKEGKLSGPVWTGLNRFRSEKKKFNYYY